MQSLSPINRLPLLLRLPAYFLKRRFDDVEASREVLAVRICVFGDSFKGLEVLNWVMLEAFCA